MVILGNYVSAQTYSTPGTYTYTVPAGTTTLQVQSWGAGGHGASRNTTGQGGGGGGGAYAEKTITVTAGESFTYTICQGSNNNNPGGDTTFGSNIVLANGGNSAPTNDLLGASGGSAASSIGAILRNGGRGADGDDTMYSGGGGSAASPNLDGTDASGSTGGTIANGGNGGNGRTGNNGSGYVGIAPGGGGGGASRMTGTTSYNGGNGGNGRIIITARGPVIDVTGKFTAIAYNSLTPSSTNHTDFGSVSVDGGSTVVTYTIKNIGSATLTIGAINRLGANQSDYLVTSSPASTLAPGASTKFSLEFDPSNLGSRVATIVIPNNDPLKSSFTFAVTGLGVRAYVDSDGDGVSDNFDIDDDNDGIPDVMEQTLCKQSPFAQSVDHIFLNETFGAGTTKGKININIPEATCSYCYENGENGTNTVACPSLSNKILDDGEYCVNYMITKATSSDPENIHGDLAWYQGEDHTVGDVNGRMAIFNANYVPGVFYETTIRGVIPNVPVSYSFWALNIMSKYNYAGSILPNITVEFRDLSNNLISTYNTGNIGRCLGGSAINTCDQSEWLQFTTSVVLGDIADFVVRFKNNAPGGGGNDLALDDIVIQQQYCDSDGDGIPNLYDLDSDNDGISDIEEAGFKQYSNGKSTMDKTSAATWVDADHNGMHDALDAMIAAGTYSIYDTDGDGVPNFMDLDSDNDSLFDVDEAGIYNGDGDINDDGLGDGIDSDKDGILDVYDNSPSFGTNARAYAKDTDNNNIPDYMQLDSNSDGIMDIKETIYDTLDLNNDGKIDGTADADKDGITDTFDTKTNGLGSPRDLNRKFFVDFDGRNDYGQGGQFTSGLAQATMMGWIKLNGPYLNNGFVMGQSNFNLRVNTAGGIKLSVSANGSTLTYGTALSQNRWYHVAAVLDPSDPAKKMKLYLNGEEVAFSNAGGFASPLNPTTDSFTLARNSTSATDFFRGSIDEVRVFNTALSDDQLQKMVYQEIKSNGSEIRGLVIPKNIELSTWSSLLAYYRMDAYKDDVIDNFVTPSIDEGSNPALMRIYNVKDIRYQLAPLPFETKLAGNIDAAVSQNNYVNGADVRAYNWAIVKMKHNIDLGANFTTLGLIINPNVKFTLSNNSKVQNSWYLKLDGSIDLVGKSQLVQTEFSDLDPTSAGSIQRNQQGQGNKFNYNYWSSPVSSMSATANNQSFTVASVMKDCSNSTSPVNINFVPGTNGSLGTPINIAEYWLFKFQNSTPSYSNWQTLGSGGILLPGQGFTMKGPDSLTEQNYVFTGKPNNGDITSTIGSNNINLVGNPYASALDANDFINQNLTAISGTLYFWEHYSTNSSHVLASYQGGYATRTLVGGVAPIAPVGISGLGSSTRVPARFIPVGQGFFIKGNDTGGTVTFSNKQRQFIKENNPNSNDMFRSVPTIVDADAALNAEDTYEEDQYMKVRLASNSHDGHHRQLLLGFMDEHATPDIDLGYDAISIDNQPTDIFFYTKERKLVIQGDGFFNPNNIYPVGVKTDAAGIVQFMLDGTENFPADQPIYIHDALNNSYNDIRTGIYETEIATAGTVLERFTLTFTAAPISKSSQIADLNNDLKMQFSSADNMVNVQNLILDATVKKVTLINLLGQTMAEWTITSETQSLIKLKAPVLSTGTYIIKVQTDKGDFSKKAIIK